MRSEWKKYLGFLEIVDTETCLNVDRDTDTLIIDTEIRYRNY